MSTQVQGQRDKMARWGFVSFSGQGRILGKCDGCQLLAVSFWFSGPGGGRGHWLPEKQCSQRHWALLVACLAPRQSLARWLETRGLPACRLSRSGFEFWLLWLLWRRVSSWREHWNADKITNERKPLVYSAIGWPRPGRAAVRTPAPVVGARVWPAYHRCRRTVGASVLLQSAHTLPGLQQEDVETQLLEGIPPLGINGLQPVFLKIFPLVLVIHLCHICQRISPVKVEKTHQQASPGHVIRAHSDAVLPLCWALGGCQPTCPHGSPVPAAQRRKPRHRGSGPCVRSHGWEWQTRSLALHQTFMPSLTSCFSIRVRVGQGGSVS